MGFLIDISDDAIANPFPSNIAKLAVCQKKLCVTQTSCAEDIPVPCPSATKFLENLERAMRFELTTFTLAR